ncbi:MAG: methionyl-tRNA formyltransferase [Nitrospirae bacterium]|nr:methionyl-tRNA formyltransferase [Nitrospirota bacterium]
MRLIFFGTPEFAVPALKALINSEHEVLAVVSQPDRRSGRGRRLALTPVKSEAQSAGLTILQPNKVKESGFIEELKRFNPEAIVTAAYGQLLPSGIIHLPKFGCINIHASLLPKYRGAAPINWAIINGDKMTGITIMLMDEGMDTGPILLHREEAIRDEDTAGSLSERLSLLGAEALIKTLDMLKQGLIKPVPQTRDASSAPLLRKDNGLIKWPLSADKLGNFIRGVNPWPGAYTFLDGKRIKILKAASVNGSGEAGIICKAQKDELFVGTGKGLLRLIEVQPAGKPVMDVRLFMQGRSLKEGMKFDDEPLN